jgi:hypothetical protein
LIEWMEQNSCQSGATQPSQRAEKAAPSSTARQGGAE